LWSHFVLVVPDKQALAADKQALAAKAAQGERRFGTETAEFLRGAHLGEAFRTTKPRDDGPGSALAASGAVRRMSSLVRDDGGG
jgi:hypothetical protein